LEAVIYERGNGFPEVGEHVSSNDGRVWLITKCRGIIHSSPGGNYCYALVGPADWSDVSEAPRADCELLPTGDD